MKNKILIIIFFTILSCAPQEVLIYHYDNSRYDGAEIDGSRLSYFFSKENTDIIKFYVKSSVLKSELTNIKEKIKPIKNISSSDGYYYYTFIYKQDTLYSDYNLNYWRNKNNGSAYKLNEKVKEEINEALKNVKVSQNNQ